MKENILRMEFINSRNKPEEVKLTKTEFRSLVDEFAQLFSIQGVIRKTSSLKKKRDIAHSKISMLREFLRREGVFEGDANVKNMRCTDPKNFTKNALNAWSKFETGSSSSYGDRE